jgi:protoporphyrinogen oxidase
VCRTFAAMKIAVIGAGPAGITVAYELAKASKVTVVVYEASQHLGGMARSFDLWGQRVDLGPHRFFSSDARVNRLWLEVIGSDYHIVDRMTRIFYQGKFFFYPLRPFDAFWTLGPIEAARCLLSYAREKVHPTIQDGTFEAWVVSRFGRRLFEIFFKTYSEKLWGIPVAELDADFASQRIRKLSLVEAVINAFAPGSRKHKTLLDQFAFPLQGSGVLYERMTDSVMALGYQVRLETPVKKVAMEDGKVVGLELMDGTRVHYDQVVSSMPLTQLVERMDEAPEEVRKSASQLRFRSTLLVYLRVEAQGLFPDNWIYIHAPELKVGRITNFRNWVPEICQGQPETILALEYWSYPNEGLSLATDAELIALATDELAQTGLAQGAKVSAGFVVRIPKCYPVYDRGYRNHLQPIEDYLKTVEGLTVIGRPGAFKYNNQDHSILMGLLAAENLLKGTTHDLWAINTDYETYQEATYISRTGLVTLEGGEAGSYI